MLLNEHSRSPIATLLNYNGKLTKPLTKRQIAQTAVSHGLYIAQEEALPHVNELMRVTRTGLNLSWHKRISMKSEVAHYVLCAASKEQARPNEYTCLITRRMR